MFLAEDPSEEVDISQPGEEGGGYGGGGRKNRHPFDVGALLAWVEANFGDGAARWGPGAARHAHRHQHRHRHHRHQRHHRHHRHHHHHRAAAGPGEQLRRIHANNSGSAMSNGTTAPLLNVGAIMELYSPIPRRGAWYAAAAMIGDYWMSCPTRRAARAFARDPLRNGSVYHTTSILWSRDAEELEPPCMHAAAAHAMSRGVSRRYVYRFLERPEDPGVAAGGQGVCHGCEILFVFNKLACTCGPASHSAGCSEVASAAADHGCRTADSCRIAICATAES
jgi:hypothetical protein